MNKTLQQLCEDIEAGYAAGLSMFDPPLVELIEELSNKTDEIKALINTASVTAAPEPIKTPQQELARELVEDWHEGLPLGHYNDWCSRAAGLLLHFADDKPAPPDQT